MKYIFILIISLIANCTYSQKTSDTDSLKKYSYNIVGLTYHNGHTSIYQGTGFFIKKGYDNLFVTARHNLLQCDSQNTKELSAPKEMRVLLTDISGEFTGEYLELYLNKLYDTGRCVLPHIDTDVIVYNIRNPKKYVLYTINNLIYPKLLGKKWYVNVFRFPAKEIEVKDHVLVEKTASQLYFKKYKFLEYDTYKSPTGLTLIDSLNYMIKSRKVPLDSLGGYSGSPVFIKDKKDKKWKLLGLAIAVFDGNKLVVTKQKLILQKIKDFK